MHVLTNIPPLALTMGLGAGSVFSALEVQLPWTPLQLTGLLRPTNFTCDLQQLKEVMTKYHNCHVQPTTQNCFIPVNTARPPALPPPPPTPFIFS